MAKESSVANKNMVLKFNASRTCNCKLRCSPVFHTITANTTYQTGCLGVGELAIDRILPDNQTATIFTRS